MAVKQNQVKGIFWAGLLWIPGLVGVGYKTERELIPAGVVKLDGFPHAHIWMYLLFYRLMLRKGQPRRSNDGCLDATAFLAGRNNWSYFLQNSAGLYGQAAGVWNKLLQGGTSNDRYSGKAWNQCYPCG